MIYKHESAIDYFYELYRFAFQDVKELIDGETVYPTGYDIILFYLITDLFTQAKKRIAMRARNARDGQGNTLINELSLTDDEYSWYKDDIMPTGAAEVFRKISAWSKLVTNPFRYGITFGEKTSTGTVTSITDNVVLSTGLALTVNALVGNKFVITSGTEINDERVITANTSDTITLDAGFNLDVTDATFNVYVSDADAKYIVMAMNLGAGWDLNMLQAIETGIKEALLLYGIKEWYLLNRQMDDYTVEESRYQNELTKIRSQLMQVKTPVRRSADFFS
jgi:hypothetical protein